jgi:hypothetical protein
VDNGKRVKIEFTGKKRFFRRFLYFTLNSFKRLFEYLKNNLQMSAFFSFRIRRIANEKGQQSGS